ncbi:MAG: electron transfer flavoprotein subunit beta/FixA family protein [Sandaracinaceae bacterium]|nr:electron transfer flavoprotein subunit beta/FixA family protein [Sandaracinaceae bacterium]
MKILVPIKRVADPDNANKVKVSGDGTQVTSEGLEWKMNPFDEWSLEAALRLTENGATKARTGEVVLVSIGPKDAAQTVRQGLAMGAERGILVEANDQELDSNMVAQILKAIVDKEKPDLVVMGKQTVDGDSNVAGTVLAELLGWPLANYAMSIQTADDGKTLTVRRELDTGVSTIKVTGPAVVTTSDRILKPESVKNGATPADFKYPEAEGGRYASLKGIMAAKKKPIEEVTAASLGAAPQKTLTYLKFELPPARSGKTTFVESVQELVQKLKSDAKVL